MNRQSSIGREWLTRLAVGIAMIPVALLAVGAVGAILPEAAQSLALAVGGIVYIVGSMAISMAIVHRKAK